jgi:PAS domain S-box-containing protein
MVQNIDKLLLPTFDALTAHIAVLSSTGDIVFVNDAWRIFAGENGIHPDAVSIGINYLDVCHAASKSGCDEADQFLNGLKQVLSGQMTSFSLEYPCHSDDEKRWFIGKISAFFVKGVGHAVISHEDITKRKFDEMRLKNSESRFASLVLNSPHIIFTIDQAGEILFMNHAPEGMELHQIIGRSIYDFMDPEFRQSIKKHVAAVFNGKKDLQYEVRGTGPGGIRSDYLSTIGPHDMDIRSGKVKSAIISTQEITLRKQQQKKVDESRNRLTKLLNAIDSCIYVADMETHEILFTNDYMNQIYNADLTGKICWEALHQKMQGPCDFCTNDRLLDDSGNPKGIYAWEHYNEKLDKWFEIRDQAIEWTNNKLVRLEMATDVTSRKQAEKDLRESRILFKALIDNTPAIIFMKNLEGRYFLVNRKCEEVLGIKNEDIVGKKTHEILPADVADQFVANDKKVIETGSHQNVEETIPIADGVITVLSTQFPLRNSTGEMYGICGISTDITERKYLENKLKKLNMELEDKIKKRTTDLEDMNAALKVLLKKNERDKSDIEEKILSNYESVILPFIAKLKNDVPEKKHETLLDIIEFNLKEVTSEFSKKLKDPMQCLTPAEIQIAVMVKQGLTNKEIANVLNISVRTVTSHRDAMRTKLGIKNQKINLRTYLNKS